MALHLVILPNEYFKPGTYIDITDGMAQQVEVHQSNGRLRVGRFTGFVVPERHVRHATFTVLKRGFDDKGAHAELRGAFRYTDRTPEPWVGDDPDSSILDEDVP